MQTQTPMDTGKPRAGGKQPCGARTRTCQCGHHQKLHADKAAACESCDCRTYRARLCQRKDLGAGGRCSQHGGKTPQGLASPNYRTGRWSQYLPANALGGKFDLAFRDRQVMTLRQDVALIDAMLTSYTAAMKDTGRPLNQTQQARVLGLLEQKRKHVESEARRLRELSQVVPMDQFRNAVMQLGRLILAHLGDNPAAMRELGDTTRRVLKGPVVEGDVVRSDAEGGE